MIRQQDLLFEELGYNVNDPDYIYLKDVVEEIVEGMNSHSDEEVFKLVRDRRSCLYLEPAHFYFEVGLNHFNESLDNLHSNRKPANKKIQKMIFGKSQNQTLEDTLFAVSKFISDEKKQAESKSNGKKMVLTRSK